MLVCWKFKRCHFFFFVSGVIDTRYVLYYVQREMGRHLQSNVIAYTWILNLNLKNLCAVYGDLPFFWFKAGDQKATPTLHWWLSSWSRITKIAILNSAIATMEKQISWSSTRNISNHNFPFWKSICTGSSEKHAKYLKSLKKSDLTLSRISENSDK